jgi:hypothetical protein
MTAPAIPKNSYRSTTRSLRSLVVTIGVNANYLPTALSDVTRFWLVKLPEGTIYNWDQLCAIFIGNF